jgi:hypothetical protein
LYLDSNCLKIAAEGKILLNTELRQNLKISLNSYCLYTLGRTSLELIILCHADFFDVTIGSMKILGTAESSPSSSVSANLGI